MTKNKFITFSVYLYIALPFLIFAAGFLKWYFALPVFTATLAAVCLGAKSSCGITSLSFSKKEILPLISGAVIIVLMVLLSGIGDVFWQNNDHATRNTIFKILSEYSWPPKYITDAGNEVGMVYYIGFWLPSAIISKLFSLSWGYVFQIIWASLGLFLLWYMLCVMHKKIVIYPLIIFLFFSGIDTVAHSLVDMLYSNLSNLQIGKWAFSQGSPLTYHIEWWANYFQYSSHTTQLFWVFNQCIPVWLATVLIILEKNNRNMVLIMGLTLLSSTLPFIGLIPIFVWCAVCDHEGDYLDRPFTKDVKKSFFSLFTYQNIVGGGLSGILSFLYLKGNIASAATSTQANSTQAAQSGFSFSVFVIVLVIYAAAFLCLCNKDFKPTKLLYLIPALPLAFLMARLPIYKLSYYLMFIIFEFILLSLLLIPAHGKSSLFFVTLSCLLIVPFFTVGKSIDFCMRASIPLLVVLCLFTISAVKKYFDEDKQILATLLCAALMLGAITPITEIARTVEATAYEISTKGSVVNDSKTIHQVFGGKNFTGRTENNVFFEIFAK